MCRWMAWSGQPVIIDEMLFKPTHGLIDQSLHSAGGRDDQRRRLRPRLVRRRATGPASTTASRPPGATTTCASSPPTSSRRCSSPTCARRRDGVQETNCHPFRHGKWLFVHNGVVDGFHAMRRELMLAVAPELFAEIQGSTDSEVLFHLALTFGLEEDPLAAMERTIGLVEATADARDRQRGAGDDRHQRRRAAVGDPLLDRGEVADAVPSAEPDTVRELTPTTPASRASARRTGSWSRSRSPSCRGVGRDPRGDRARGPARRGSAGAVPAARRRDRERAPSGRSGLTARDILALAPDTA